jgi:hypothetical protein
MSFQTGNNRFHVSSFGEKNGIKPAAEAINNFSHDRTTDKQAKSANREKDFGNASIDKIIKKKPKSKEVREYFREKVEELSNNFTDIF